MARTAKEIIKVHSQMKEDMRKYRKLKRICISLSYPMRSDAWDEYQDTEKGEQRGKEIFDSTAAKDLELWSAGIMGYYSPKDAPWFINRFGDKKLMESKTVRRWLQDLDDHLRYTLSRSGCMGVGGYYEAKKTAIMDSGCIGDSYLMIDEDVESGKLMCQTPHPREFTVRRDYFGRVVEIHREWKKTLQQIKDEFGEKALTDGQEVDLNSGSGDTEVTLIHATDRNPDYDPTRMGSKYMKWRTALVSAEAQSDAGESDGKIIKEGGYRTLNPVPWSLNRVTHETYGRGIISQILIEILTANYIGRDMLDVSQQAAQPTMIVTSALEHRFTRKPGKTIFAQTEGLGPITKAGDMAARLIDSSGYPFGMDMLQRWQQMIDERFGVALFLEMNRERGKDETATAFLGRKAERVILMAPFLSTLGSNTDMELDRVFDIELASGRAPEPPEEVLRAVGSRIDVQYIGPLHHLLEQYYGTHNLLEAIEYIQYVASVPGFEDVGINVDKDRLLRKLLEKNNAPEDIVLEPDEVAELRAIIAQQQEAQMMAELAAKAGKGARGLGAKVDESSVLAGMEEIAAA